MTRIGSAWQKVTQTGKGFIPLSFDEEILPLTIEKGKNYVLWEIPQDKKTSDKSPDYTIDVFIPEEK